jgi:hypothetical protein
MNILLYCLSTKTLCLILFSAVNLPAFDMVSQIIDQANGWDQKMNLSDGISKPEKSWPGRFRREAELVVPQNRFGSLLRWYWLRRWLGPHPRKEWKDFVKATIDAMSLLSTTEYMLLGMKSLVHVSPDSLGPSCKHLVDW